MRIWFCTLDVCLSLSHIFVTVAAGQKVEEEKEFNAPLEENGQILLVLCEDVFHTN